MTTYLDDPDHDWSFDTLDADGMSLEQMMNEMSIRDWDGLGMILRGYAGLKSRHPKATDEACLRTSMIWYYG